jgi:hypothetical protein
MNFQSRKTPIQSQEGGLIKSKVKVERWVRGPLCMHRQRAGQSPKKAVTGGKRVDL